MTTFRTKCKQRAKELGIDFEINKEESGDYNVNMDAPKGKYFQDGYNWLYENQVEPEELDEVCKEYYKEMLTLTNV